MKTNVSAALEMLTAVYNDLRTNTDKLAYLNEAFESETNFNDIGYSIIYDYISKNDGFLDRIDEIIGMLRETAA
jgi:lipopolysaccharide biosynthesis regulator YciM